ncbi:MAG: mechanosensitive ion channel family protein [Armatimonadota bacterium]|nr:mechanosensitive ion channel family protein [Armatimonadota bacterium]MDR7533617.1 mechanosensitive ion channel family protein [Armatimonadota bacterium]MDR7537335.1 mechanosensitive ion channel family protein [Armatimonadota bacterium]
MSLRLQASSLRRALESLASPERLAHAAETVFAIVLIVAGMGILLRLTTALLRRSVRPDDPRHPPERQAQIRTLVPLLESALRYVFYFTAAVMVLDRLRFNVSAILASAGIAGIAIGFGAQHLIRDIIAGFFLIFEGHVQVGDVVRVGEVVGQVENLSLRTVQIRQFSGELVTIPNGEISRIGNMNRSFMRAIVHVSLPYGADVTRAMAVMQEVAAAWAKEQSGIVLSPPEVQGVIDLGATDVRVRVVVTVRPGAQVAAELELRRRMLHALAAAGIELPPAAALLGAHRAAAPGGH